MPDIPVVLLYPQPPEGDPDPVTAERPGFFELTSQKVRAHLARDEHLHPRGIASLLAPVHYLTWRLENQEVPRGQTEHDAVAVLRLTVLLQYLGYLEPVTVRRDDDTLAFLAPVLGKAWRPEDPAEVLIWRLRGIAGDGGWNDEVFALTHPSLPLVPAPRFFPAAGAAARGGRDWRGLRQALVATIGPGTSRQWVNADAEVRDGSVARGLARYLASFIAAAGPGKPGWKTAFVNWRESLDRIASGDPVADHDMGVGVDLGGGGGPAAFGFKRYAGLDGWRCAGCAEAGSSWTDRAEEQVIEAAADAPRCLTHREPLTVNGRNIPPEQYGAYVASDGRRYVWIDDVVTPLGMTRKQVHGTPGQAGQVTYTFNRRTLTVKGHLVSRDRVLLSGAEVWLSRTPGASPTPVDVPVPGDHVHLVRSCSTDLPGRRWVLELYGLEAPQVVPFGATPGGSTALWSKAAIVVWPPERGEGWTLDYVGVSTAQAQKARFRLVEVLDKGRLQCSGDCHTDAVYATRGGWLRYIELGEATPAGSFRSLGLLDVKRDLVPPPAAPVSGRVGLDFGTSSTVVRWLVPGDTARRYALSGEDSGQPCLFVARDETDMQSLLNGVDVHAPWNSRETPPRPYLPSLHARPADDKPTSQNVIPPRGQGLHLLASPAKGGEPRIVSGLKWRNWTVPAVKARVESFLEVALAQALWGLRRAGCSRAEFVATYPLAFDSDRKVAYEMAVLRDVLKQLAIRTGIAADRIELVSESAAAYRCVPRVSATHVVSLDVGGGTTDLAVTIGEGGEDFGPVRTVLLADSVEYAGRDFLRAILVPYGAQYFHTNIPLAVREITPPNPQAIGDAEELTEAYVATLEAFVHHKGVPGLRSLLLGEKSPDLQLKWLEVLYRWEALLAGLLLYTRRAVEASLAGVDPSLPVSIQFNFFGMGWGVLRLLAGDPTQSIAPFLEQRLRNLCNEIAQSSGRSSIPLTVFGLAGGQDPKTAVVDGALLESRAAPSASAPEHAGAMDVRKTFVGMEVPNPRGRPVSAVTLLSAAGAKPSVAGDPGYGKLIDQLFAEVPEHFPGTATPLRPAIQDLLLGSAKYKRSSAAPDVRNHLVNLGQGSFNDTWAAGAQLKEGLLGAFLSSVWRQVWADTPL